MASQQAPIVWGIGRHRPGNGVFFMVRDPNGNLAEISFGIGHASHAAPPACGRMKSASRTFGAKRSCAAGQVRTSKARHAIEQPHAPDSGPVWAEPACHHVRAADGRVGVSRASICRDLSQLKAAHIKLE